MTCREYRRLTCWPMRIPTVRSSLHAPILMAFIFVACQDHVELADPSGPEAPSAPMADGSSPSRVSGPDECPEPSETEGCAEWDPAEWSLLLNDLDTYFEGATKACYDAYEGVLIAREHGIGFWFETHPDPATVGVGLEPQFVGGPFIGIRSDQFANPRSIAELLVHEGAHVWGYDDTMAYWLQDVCVS